MIFTWHEVFLNGNSLGFVVYDYVTDTLFGGIVPYGDLKGAENWCTHPRDWKREPVYVVGAEDMVSESVQVCLECMCLYTPINQ